MVKKYLLTSAEGKHSHRVTIVSEKDQEEIINEANGSHVHLVPYGRVIRVLVYLAIALFGLSMILLGITLWIITRALPV